MPRNPHVEEAAAALVREIIEGKKALTDEDLARVFPMPQLPKPTGSNEAVRISMLDTWSRQKRGALRTRAINIAGDRYGLCLVRTRTGGLELETGPRVGRHVRKVAVKGSKATLSWCGKAERFEDYSGYDRDLIAPVLQALQEIVTALESADLTPTPETEPVE